MSRRGRHIKKDYERKTLSYLLSIFFRSRQPCTSFREITKSAHEHEKKIARKKWMEWFSQWGKLRLWFRVKRGPIINQDCVSKTAKKKQWFNNSWHGKQYFLTYVIVYHVIVVVLWFVLLAIIPNSCGTFNFIEKKTWSKNNHLWTYTTVNVHRGEGLFILRTFRTQNKKWFI